MVIWCWAQVRRWIIIIITWIASTRCMGWGVLSLPPSDLTIDNLILLLLLLFFFAYVVVFSIISFILCHYCVSRMFLPSKLVKWPVDKIKWEKKSWNWKYNCQLFGCRCNCIAFLFHERRTTASRRKKFTRTEIKSFAWKMNGIY